MSLDNKNFYDMDVASINELVLNGNRIPISEEVIDKYVDIEDIGLYRYYVSNLDVNNSYLKEAIENKRKRKYDDIFRMVSCDGLLKEYKVIYEDIINGREIETNDVDLVMGLCGSAKDIFDFLYSETSNKLKEILIDRYFRDIPHNFMANLEMMLNFISSANYNFIDKNRLELYKKIYCFDNLSISQKIDLYNGMNSGFNYSEVFYDDYRKCREYAYAMYNEKVLKIDKMNKSPLSSLYGADVYELSGEDFAAFVHQTRVSRHSDDSHVWNDNVDGIFSVNSFSMIDQNHFDTIYGNDNSYVVLGFSNLDVDRIIHVYHSDSFTSVDRGSDRINEIFTFDDLMNKTKGYNEIFYLSDNLNIKNGNGKHTVLKPTYVLCYDYITNLEIEIAKKYHIALVLFHTEKYINKVDPKIYYDGKVYLNYDNKKKRK